MRLYNLARMTTATTGTGTITLGAAVTNHISFASAGVNDGETIAYAIEDGANSEQGTGVYNSSGTTLTRVLRRSTTGSLLNLSGNAQVFITPGAEEFQVVTNAQTGTSYTVVNSDFAKLVTLSNASAVSVTLPQATGAFNGGWYADFFNLGAGLVTITPTTSTINERTSLTLSRGHGVRVVSDGTNYQIAGVTLPQGPLSGFRNLLINGCMRFNQRVSTTAADDTYCFDRWYALTQSGAVGVSQLTNVENGWPYAIRLTQSQASAQRFGLAQIIEAADSYGLRGQAVVLQARVRCSASTTLRYAMLEWTGTADTVTSDVVSDWTSSTYTTGNFFISTTTTVVATGSTALTSATAADITVLSGSVSSSANNVIVLFWTDSTQAQNVTLDLGRVQLERGANATHFENRHYSTELSLCQRFYEKSYSPTVAPATTTIAGGVLFINETTTSSVGNVPFTVTKRASPDITIYNTSTGVSGSIRSNGANITGVTLSSFTNERGFSSLTATGLTTNVSAFFQYVAVAEL